MRFRLKSDHEMNLQARIAELEAELEGVTARWQDCYDSRKAVIADAEAREQRAREKERKACETDVFVVLHHAPWDLPQPTDEQRAFANGLHAAIAAIRRPTS